MTPEFQASRTLVKSPPELWAECSDAGSLARHIGEFGEIRITRLEPETSVSWEAEHASGTVEIEPSGWGTRVTLTAHPKADEVTPEPVEMRPAEAQDPAEAAAEPPHEAAAEPPHEAAAEPPSAQAEPVKEEPDAKVEETVAESHPAVAADAGLAGGRWKRLIARTRVWFGTPGRVATESPPPHEPTVGPPDPAPVEVNEPQPEEVSEPEVVTPEPEPVLEVSAPEPAESAEALQAPEVPEVPDLPQVLEPSSEPQPLEPPGGPDSAPALDPDAVLIAALDSLGQAHHRPFSRA